LKYANREQRDTDKVFPFGYTPKTLSKKELIKAEELFTDLGIFQKKVTLRICLFATLNNSFNVETLVKAAKLLTKKNSNIQFVICGRGEKLETYKKESEELTNFFFPGWVDFPTIKFLMKISDVGIAPYINTPDFAASIPNKAIEYFSGGLPILTSIDGHLTEILEENNCGWFYENNKPDRLANILIEIEADKEKLALMKHNAKKLFEENFIADKVYNTFMKHLTTNIKSN